MKPVNTTKILVVDDEEMLRRAIIYDLKKRGYQVSEADCGNGAWEHISSNPVDLVLSDVKMPNGDGIELLKKIKGMQRDIPIVIFMTAYSDLTQAEAYDLGVDAILEKPFDRVELADTIARLLRPRPERWSVEACKANMKFRLSLQFPDLKTAIESNLINIGRGGMFAALKDGDLPPIKTECSFELSAGDEKIQGTGIIRWTRSDPEGNLHRGCGIEFSQLDVTSLNKILEMIKLTTHPAFIPKG